MRKPVPGRLFVWVARVSWLELAIFSALIAFWVVPGYQEETMVFGWAHGIGFVGLCILIWISCVKREAPYTLLAATLTPVGPLGSVIAIELIKRGWGIAEVPQSIVEASQCPAESPQNAQKTLTAEGSGAIASR